MIPLATWIPRVTPAYSEPKHLDVILDFFDRIEREEVSMCVSIPPRHAKTETILHGIARLLLRHPHKKIAYVAYSADQAQIKSRALRDIAINAGVVLRADSTALRAWLTPEGGGVVAVGTGGPLTGQGFDLLVIDDPFKNRQEADSPLIRERIYNWFTSTALTRVEPDGSRLVTHTRWHKDDLIGRLQDDEKTKWERFSLPAISAQGKALWPERWPLPKLEARRDSVGEYDWESLFQQNPTVRKGRVYAAFDKSIHVVPHAQLATRQWRRIIVGVDWGFTDAGVMLVCAESGMGQIVVLEEIYEKQVLVDADGWLKRAKDLRSKYRLERFVADPSEAGYIRSLRLALGGAPVVEQANNAISDGVTAVQSALQVRDKTPGLLISSNCTNTIREMENYLYAVGPEGPTEVPRAGNDHAMDALRYAVMSLKR